MGFFPEPFSPLFAPSLRGRPGPRFCGSTEGNGSAPGAAGVLYACLPALGKVLFDIAVYEPVYDAVYLSLQGLLRGERLAPRELLSAVLAVWRRAPYYWAPADIINFSLVSTRLRPLYNAVASIPWSMHLSQSANA